MPRRPVRRHVVTIHLTVEERDMLLAHAQAESGLPDFLRNGREVGPLVSLELDNTDVDDFLTAFDATANSAQNDLAMTRLSEAFVRVESGLAGEADPGWHMLRPAMSRLDISPKQAQYLAFIQTYTRVHRRAPAESEIQAYFQTTPPSVHEMLKTLARKQFISRAPGVARSTRILLAPHQIPDLE